MASYKHCLTIICFVLFQNVVDCRVNQATPDFENQLNTLSDFNDVQIKKISSFKANEIHKKFPALKEMVRLCMCQLKNAKFITTLGGMNNYAEAYKMDASKLEGDPKEYHEYLMIKAETLKNDIENFVVWCGRVYNEVAEKISECVGALSIHLTKETPGIENYAKIIKNYGAGYDPKNLSKYFQDYFYYIKEKVRLLNNEWLDVKEWCTVNCAKKVANEIEE